MVLIMQELTIEDPCNLKNFIQMDIESFNELLIMVDPLIKRKNTSMRNPIPAAERLALTLRFLATGESYQSLQYLYRISRTAVSQIIPETCEAIYNVLRNQFLKVQNIKEEWEKVATDFEERWNFPNCIGAIDGKHIMLKCPTGSGSTFYNYKHQFNVILLAVVDADYNFVYIDVGTNGRANDSGVFGRSVISHMLENYDLNLPEPKALEGRHMKIPYVIVGDDAFPLKPYLMKPYPRRNIDQSKRIFNYRLSRARRIVENVFGILAARFRIFEKPIPLDPDKVTTIVLAACALHNFLRSKTSSRKVYMPYGSIDSDDTLGDWRHEKQCECFERLTLQGGNRYTGEGRSVRDEFCDYNGQVPWQWDMA